MAQQVIDQGDPRKYWTQIPNLVFDLGLSPHELSLYVHLKRTAGESGKCFKSTRTLSKETGMGVATVSRTKTELEKPREILGGKPLIRTAKRPNPKGGKDYDEIKLSDIWLANTTHFASSTQELEPESQVPENADQVPHRNLASSTVEHKKNYIEEDNKKNNSADFFSTLKTNPLYTHVDFNRQIGLMQQWLARPKNKGRRMTERFVVGWLNNIEPPVEIPVNGNSARAAAHYVPNDAEDVCIRCHNTGTETTAKGSRYCNHQERV